ncbi:hypothetical protein FLM44_21600 [Pseudoalteromonas luteoviolacea]|nr:hypothetical protein FLM44_21600 [Pseudoalteromonas luteoviolacea]
MSALEGAFLYFKYIGFVVVNDEYRIDVSDTVVTLNGKTERDLKSSFGVELRYIEPDKYQFIFKSGFHEFLNACPGVGELANMLPSCTQQLSEFLIIDEPDIGLAIARDTLYNDALLLILEELAKYSGESVESLFDLIKVQILRDLNTILMRDVDDFSLSLGEHTLFESRNRERTLRIESRNSVKVVELSDIKRIICDEKEDEYEVLKKERWQAHSNTKMYSNTGLNYTKYHVGEDKRLDLFEYVYKSQTSTQEKCLKRTIQRLV